MELTAAQIAACLKGTVEGNPDAKVNTFNKIEEGRPGGLSFLANPKYTPYIYETQASIVLVNRDFVPEKPIAATLVRVDDAYAGLATLLKMVTSGKALRNKIDRKASVSRKAKLGKGLYVGQFTVVSPGAEIGDNCQIYPQVYIGENVKIGRNCLIYPGVRIYSDCVIGNNCTLHAGVVIGGDGFGFAPLPDGSYDKIPQVGNVVLEDNVEICANTTVDRATMGSTIIRKGVKLDNLIQVAHNVEVGENTVMAAQSGIAGSTKVGSNCIIGGQVGIAGHLHIAPHTSIAAQSGIIGDVRKEGEALFGSPAYNAKQFMRNYVLFRKFDNVYKELQTTRKELEELKKKINQNNG